MMHDSVLITLLKINMLLPNLSSFFQCFPMFIIQICHSSYEVHEEKNEKKGYEERYIASFDQLKSKGVTASLFFHLPSHVTSVLELLTSRSYNVNLSFSNKLIILSHYYTSSSVTKWCKFIKAKIRREKLQFNLHTWVRGSNPLGTCHLAL